MSEYNNHTSAELLPVLAAAFGPSGCEGNVADIIKEFISPYADEITYDGLGSVIALYRARILQKPYDSEEEPAAPSGAPDVSRLMLCAHMDEPGFMVKSIDADGYLKIAPLCGKNPKILAARNVTVGDENRKTIGYIGVKPTHLGGSGDFDSLYIDIGAKDKEEAEDHVKIGDFGTYRSDFVRFGQGGSHLKCKALDSRTGCAILCTLIKNLCESKAALPFDTYFVFTCRDEITSSSAGAAARKINPDYAVIIGGESANDICGEDYSTSVMLGKGAVVSIMDRGTIYDKEMFNFILQAAEKNNIPVQMKKYVTASNGAAFANRALTGVKCAEISVPVRYSRTASCTISEADFDAAEKLISSVIAELCV